MRRVGASPVALDIITFPEGTCHFACTVDLSASLVNWFSRLISTGLSQTKPYTGEHAKPESNELLNQRKAKGEPIGAKTHTN
jgi:hypothetical protein